MDPLTQFVESRLPMVRYSLGDPTLPTRLGLREFRGMSRYSVQQAFFYQLDWYLDEPVLMSEEAWKYVQGRYGPAADRIWSARRHAVPDFEKALPRELRAGYSKLKIIYEHVFTGSMFWSAVEEMHKAGNLDTSTLVDFIRRNYRAAWIHRDENKGLPQSRRGKTLIDAWQCYKSRPIVLKTSPTETFAYPAASTVEATARSNFDEATAPSKFDAGDAIGRFVARSEGSEWPLVQVGGPLDPGSTKRHRVTTGFLPESWLGITRYMGKAYSEHWKSGLPLVFWLETTKKRQALIAEVGPWHDKQQRKQLTSLLRDLPWTKDREAGDVYWRFWRRNLAGGGDLSEALADAWEELVEVLPDVEAALEDAGILGAQKLSG